VKLPKEKCEFLVRTVRVLAGRWWGDSSVQPVVGLHGLEDNANSFATLAPMLDLPSFLAIDMMGHGLSSHFPVNGPYHLLDFVVLLRRIADHFKWMKLSLIGNHWCLFCVRFLKQCG
jgi:pimeloyl-ACP methyl ester carboxylesterase